MGRKILRVGAFLLGLLLLLWGLAPIFVPKDNTDWAGMHNVNANSILAEPENTIDVLFLGDSEAYCAFIPMRLWKNAGIPAYVCSSVDQKLYETEQFLHTAFEKQRPKVVVLETNVLYRVYPSTDTIAPAVESYFLLFRYHDRWKSLTLADFTGRPNYTHVRADKGYHLITAVEPADTEGYMRPMEEWEPLSRDNLRYLRRIREFCREQGAELILFSSPSPANWTVRRHNTVTDVAEALEVTFLDGNLMADEIPIDWQRDTSDGGDHLNYYGACKVTDFFTALLKRRGDLPDRREDTAYAQWDDCLARFEATLPQS